MALREIQLLLGEQEAEVLVRLELFQMEEMVWQIAFLDLLLHMQVEVEVDMILIKVHQRWEGLGEEETVVPEDLMDKRLFLKMVKIIEAVAVAEKGVVQTLA